MIVILVPLLLIGMVHFSSDDAVFLGKIEGTDDLVTFEGESVRELKRAFKEAVEDYIQLCEASGRSAHKSYKGSFTVRISPELHRQAAILSQKSCVSLNQLVQTALETEVEKTRS